MQWSTPRWIYVELQVTLYINSSRLCPNSSFEKWVRIFCYNIWNIFSLICTILFFIRKIQQTNQIYWVNNCRIFQLEYIHFNRFWCSLINSKTIISSHIGCDPLKNSCFLGILPFLWRCHHNLLISCFITSKVDKLTEITAILLISE